MPLSPSQRLLVEAHQRFADRPICRHCGYSWPCPVAILRDENVEQREEIEDLKAALAVERGDFGAIVGDLPITDEEREYERERTRGMGDDLPF